ncbi:MAG: hypothetical protein AAF039_10065 [Bacteroidota bacterium]
MKISMRYQRIPLLGILYLLLSVLVVSSCSSDDGSSDDDGGSGAGFDPMVITGIYDGTTTLGGTAPASAIIRSTSTANQFRFEFFSGVDQMGCCNTDQSRPDASGTFNYENGGDIDLELRWTTDAPVCNGILVGMNGTFDSNVGRIDIRITQQVDCGADATFDVIFFKTEDL